MTNITLAEIAQARRHIPLIRHQPAADTLIAALDWTESELLTPITFLVVPAGWRIGLGVKTRDVASDLRGLEPAWTALRFGRADLTHFAKPGQRATDDTIRNSIRGACATWARRNGCPELAWVFAHHLTVEQRTVTYRPPPGARRVTTAL
jgi:hypothetical protein